MSLDVIKAGLCSQINYILRTIKEAGYIRPRTPIKYAKKLTTETQLKEAKQWLEQFEEKFVIPFDEIRNCHTAREWIGLLRDIPAARECKEFNKRRKALREAWNNRPEYLKDKKPVNFKKKTTKENPK